eukprot:210226-Amphidinium_carterae.1
MEAIYSFGPCIGCLKMWRMAFGSDDKPRLPLLPAHIPSQFASNSKPMGSGCNSVVRVFSHFATL